MLEDYRKEIDSIDAEILKLLNRRTEFVVKIGKLKSKENKEFYQPGRERKILKRLEKANKGPFPTSAVKNVFREIMSASLSVEQPLKVAFLGPVATFTHQASIQYFGLSGKLIPKKEIADVFEAVEKGRADFGVVPIENTAEGVVTHTLDMFVTSDLKVCAEVMFEVSLALLNKSGKTSDIQRVCSHPHAIGQCKGWVKENLPGVQLVEVSSTAKAAELAGVEPETAAIASSAAAELYNLRVIERNIQDTANNYTRFLVIGKLSTEKSGCDKTSLVFAIKDSPGALFKMLAPFAERGINLTKIESRPLKTKAWEYLFFVDMDGHIADKNLKEAVEGLKRSAMFLKVLGSYPRSEEPGVGSTVD
jgi:chorismate mutase/prephenate dehydratase